MSLIDVDLPFALIDLVVACVQAVMGAILMCFAAGYFALTMPAVVLAVWGKRYTFSLAQYILLI
jgi:ATP-binding cassette subfamily C (CFTR/MRP) protein 1